MFIKDNDFQAFSAQDIRTSKSGRTGAYNRCTPFSFTQSLSFQASAQNIIRTKSCQCSDSNGTSFLCQRTSALAQSVLGTNTSANLRHCTGFQKYFAGFQKFLLPNEVHHFSNRRMLRTNSFAGSAANASFRLVHNLFLRKGQNHRLEVLNCRNALFYLDRRLRASCFCCFFSFLS